LFVSIYCIVEYNFAIKQGMVDHLGEKYISIDWLKWVGKQCQSKILFFLKKGMFKDGYL
jgi:hypothetical protein